MIKGVNRRVIEINNPDGEYCEKAILFVKPEKSGDNPKTLKTVALEYLSDIDENNKRRRRRTAIILSAILMAVATLIVTLVIL